MKYTVLMLMYFSYYSVEKLGNLCVKSGLVLGFDRVNGCLLGVILEVLLPKKKTHKNVSPKFSLRDGNSKMIPSCLSFTYLVEV